MKKTRELASRLREVILNGTWIANTNFSDQLKESSWELVTQTPGHVHSIAELAQHIHYYVAGIKNVFVNGSLDIRDKYSFDFPVFTSQAQWDTFREKFVLDTEELAQLIEQMPESQLKNAFVDIKYGTYERNIDGLIEHAYYHLGQVVLINKWLQNMK